MDRIVARVEYENNLHFVKLEPNATVADLKDGLFLKLYILPGRMRIFRGDNLLQDHVLVDPKAQYSLHVVRSVQQAYPNQ